MSNKFNPDLITNWNGEPSSGVKRRYREASQHPFPEGIITRHGGACWAVGIIVEAKAEGKKIITLPPQCFVQRFDSNGEAVMSSIIDEQFAEGIALGNLTKSIGKFKATKVAKTSKAIHKVSKNEIHRSVSPIKKIVIKEVEYRRGK